MRGDAVGAVTVSLFARLVLRDRSVSNCVLTGRGSKLEAGLAGSRWGGSESAAAMAAYRETLCLLIEQSTH